MTRDRDDDAVADDHAEFAEDRSEIADELAAIIEDLEMDSIGPGSGTDRPAPADRSNPDAPTQTDEGATGPTDSSGIEPAGSAAAPPAGRNATETADKIAPPPADSNRAEADGRKDMGVAGGETTGPPDESGAIRLPRGDLVRSRVVSDSATVLATALDCRLTGYAVLEPQDSLLLDTEAAAVITFEDGVPVLAYHTRTDRGGARALADLAEPGPLRADLYELPASALVRAHETRDLQVPPGMPAEQLGGDPDLADRTRERAPEDRAGDDEGDDPVVSFLEDEAKIDAIREQAREQARERAEQWGFTGELSDE